MWGLILQPVPASARATCHQVAVLHVLRYIGTVQPPLSQVAQVGLSTAQGAAGVGPAAKPAPPLHPVNRQLAAWLC
jgi:organic hydroperoxide reductase OsmC/OhrA